MTYETILYECDGAVATITLNRPERLNTIVPPMPDELEQAVIEANRDREVRVIILRGAGRAFCAGFDFSDDFGHFKDMLYTEDRWDPGKDFIATTTSFFGPVPKFMSLWRSPKPVIAQVHGWCVGGGSDMALCADIIIAVGRRADRHALLAGVGLLPDRYVAVSPGADESEMATRSPASR